MNSQSDYAARERRGLLTSFGFVTALSLLLLNDFILKASVGGVIIGKLSDFAGLFVFPLFWTAAFPRLRTSIHWATAFVFTCWKLPVSGPFIDLWNAWMPLPVGRTVDPTDLIALVSVACAWWFSSAPRRQIPVPILRWAVVPIALFAFAATSFWSVQRYERTYLFRGQPAEVRQSLARLGIQERTTAHTIPHPALHSDGTGELNVSIPAANGFAVHAALHIDVDAAGSAITLRRLEYGLPPSRGDSVVMIDFFEQCFVQRLDSLLTRGAGIRPSAVTYPGGRNKSSDWCGR